MAGVAGLEEAIAMRDVQLRKETRVLPKCPHCKKDLDEISCRELRGGRFGKRFIYFCPSCRNTLGVSHRKGFWMG